MPTEEQLRRWREIDTLLCAALEQDPSDRISFVRERTRDDRELGTAVEELLQASERTDGFLDTPIDIDSGALLRATGEFFTAGVGARSPGLEPGDVVGAWRIERELGRGGMATVFLAERIEGGFEQTAALKLLREDIHAEVVERFRAERQILSDLSHPNIARLLDGGSTADGRPYLVMEAVTGRPLLDWCDHWRAPIRERLRLFREVLSAVQYAHTNLVVHQDLKPSNLLVTEDGQVKLLDFGVARLLTSEEEADGSREKLLLTPEYAAPEQVTGGRITTASDVYQLGMILYCLLTGRRPYEVILSPREELVHSIVEGVTPPPSSVAASLDEATASLRGIAPARLAARLRGDLDAIVMKALNKQPEQRYASVGEFDADIASHLQGRPLPAVGTSRSYRVRKYFARNRWALPALAAAAALTGAYVGLQANYSSQLEAERNVATAEAERAEAIKNFLVDVFRSPDPWRSADPRLGRELKVRDALSTGVERARVELADRPDVRAELLAAIGTAYRRLGLPGDARSVLEEAVSIERAGSESMTPPEIGYLLQLGLVLHAMDRLDTASVVLEEALEGGRPLPPPHDTAAASALIALGGVARDAGDYVMAERRASEGLDMLSERDDASALRLRGLQLLASVYPQLDRADDAERVARLGVELATSAFGESSPRTANAVIRLANTMDWLGRSYEAVPLYRQAVAILEGALGPEHDETLVAMNNVAVSLSGTDRYAEADSTYRRLLDIRTAQTGVWDREVATLLQNLAANSLRWGRISQAEDYATRAHRVFAAVLEPGHPHLALPLLTRSSVELLRGRWSDAERSSSEALSILEKALPEGHFTTAMAECRLGRALLGQDRIAEAEARLRSSVAVVAGATQVLPEHQAECLHSLADVLEATGRAPESMPFRTAAVTATDG